MRGAAVKVLHTLRKYRFHAKVCISARLMELTSPKLAMDDIERLFGHK